MSRRSADSQTEKKGAKSPVPAQSAARGASANTSKNKNHSSANSRADLLMQAFAAAASSDQFQLDGTCEMSSPESTSESASATTAVFAPSVQREVMSATAIEAAREILSESPVSAPAVNAMPVERPALADKAAADQTSAVAVLRGDLQQLGKTLRDEFRNSILELQNAQAAAIASQSEVLRTLTEMIYQTSGSQDVSADSLERAFSGIEERLLEKIGTLTGPGHGSESAQESPQADSKTPASALSKTGSGLKLKNAASAVSQSWQQIRDEMINKEDSGDQESPSDTRGSADQLPEVAQLTSDRHFRIPEQDPSLEIPKPVDPEALSDQELRELFRAREAFISTLIARLRRQQDQATGQLSPEQLRTLLNDLPEELAVQVRHTLKQMEELARLGELELSLERARIARQVNQLEHSRMLIERNARQLGLLLNPDGSLTTPSAKPGRTRSSSRRWLGKLGFGQ